MSHLMESLISQLNLKFDLETFLAKVELNNNIKREFDAYFTSCPFHQNKNNFFLSINPKTRTFKCSQPGCKAEEGGKLVDLYSKMLNISTDESAIKIFDEIGIENPEDNQPLIRNLFLNIAEKHELEGLNESAKNTLLKAYQFFPKNLIILSRLGNIHSKEKNIEKACKYLLQAVEIVMEMRNYSSAHSTLRRIFSLDPYNEKAIKLRNSIFYQEWKDYLEEKITKEEKENFEKKVNFKEIPIDLRAKITVLIFKYKRPEMLKDLLSDIKEEASAGTFDKLTDYLNSLEDSIEGESNIEDIFSFTADLYSLTKNNNKMLHYLNLAKDAIIAEKSSIPLVEIENKLEQLEEELSKNDFLLAQNLEKEGKLEEASKIYRKIIDCGIKKNDVYEKLIIDTYKLGNEEEAAKICIELSDFFYRRDNHIGALISLYRGLNFVPDYEPVVDKLYTLYESFGYKELAEEIKVESEKRKANLIKSYKPTSPKSQIDSKFKTPPKPDIGVLDEDLDIEIHEPAKKTPPQVNAVNEKVGYSKTSKSPETPFKKPSTPLPFKSSDEIPIEMPVSFRLSSSDIKTDLSTVADATTVSLGMNTCKINIGSEPILGLPAVSINYSLTNAQIIMFFALPEEFEPIRLFAKITKVQNATTSKGFNRILNIELVTDDYPDRKQYLVFLEKYRRGEIDLRKAQVKPFDFKNKKQEAPKIQYASPNIRKPIQSSSVGSDFSFASSTSKPKIFTQKTKFSELQASVKFVGYRSSDSKPLSPITVKLVGLDKNVLEIDYGLLEIAGVRQASLNFFLRANKEVLIEFEHPATHKNFMVAGETIDTKTRREARSLLFTGYVLIKDMKDNAAQNLSNLLSK